MDERTGDEIRELQEPGENLLWIGKPATGLKLEKRNVLYLSISFAWIGISAWLFSTGRGGLPALLPVIWIIWVGKTLWGDAQARKGIVYWISESWVFVFPADSKVGGGIPLNSLSDIRLEVHPDGTGTIVARCSARGFPLDKDGQPTSLSMFQHVESPHHVYSLLLKAKASSRAMAVRDDRAETFGHLASANGHDRGH